MKEDTKFKNLFKDGVKELRNPEFLTEKEEALKDVISNKWLDKFPRDKNPPRINKKAATEIVDWVYKTGGLNKPKIHFVKNLTDAQTLANKIMNTEKHYYDAAGNISVHDFGWVAFYEFFIDIGVVEYKPFENYKELLYKANIYDTIQFDEACIVIPMPTEVHVDENMRLHNENGPAIAWDDYEQHYIHGENKPE